ncbi:MAG: Superoxide dismutase [Fe] [Chlamydiae bacterium]|nr:Superoxide dismutase [Fe] [Chlamydiota bacterium]
MRQLLVLLLTAISSLAAEYKAADFSNLYGMEGFSKDLLSQHFTLYQGYVKNTNTLNEKIEQLVKAGKDRTPDYAGLKRMYGWEFDGMRLHEYYFENLGGSGKLDSDSDLYKAIVKQFGSFDKWKKDFAATGLIRGIGWAILYEDRHTGKLTNVWINDHNLGHLAGAKPLVVMDVWEHAYITEYGLNRGKYIEAFFKNINWNVVQDRSKAQ